jgi:hypothetical protein
MSNILIDAHGPDHGLRVEYDYDTVTIADYVEFPEPDAETGKWEACYREVTIPLKEVLDPNGKHQGCYQSSKTNLHGKDKLHDAIITAAIAWLGYWGADSDQEEIVEAEGGACRFFDTYWGPPDKAKDYPKCELCQKD